MPNLCASLSECRWNVPFSKGGSMAEQPGARAEESRSDPGARQDVNTPKVEGAAVNKYESIATQTEDISGLEQNKNVSYTCAPQNDVGVGDLTSSAKGSGARYNVGKAPMEMVPVWIIAAGEAARLGTPEMREAWRVLNALGQWQVGGLPIADVFCEIGPGAWAEAAEVFHHVTTRPVKPYPAWNWAKGMPWSVPTACAVRHLLAILRGEHLDPETGLPHRGHAMCNLIMLAQYERTYQEGDDRPAFLKDAVA